MASTVDGIVANIDEVEEKERFFGEHYGARVKVLTPSMRARGGKLGINRMCVPKGRSVCPFHFHEREDEAFVVLSGRGVLRYGDELREIGPGDCISCPAGTKIAHQIANPHDEDLIYLAIGLHHPHEVCGYPDADRVLVRSLGSKGTLAKADYFDGEPIPPRIFELCKEKG